MNLFKRYESCFGVSFPPIGRKKIEFWFCLPRYEIKEHTHLNENIKLLFLFGHNIVFHRRKKGEFLSETFLARLRDIGTLFTINAGDAHFFTVSNWPLIFMNIETWKEGVEITSASDDLQLT
jgi:hypothetical protein